MKLTKEQLNVLAKTIAKQVNIKRKEIYEIKINALEKSCTNTLKEIDKDEKILKSIFDKYKLIGNDYTNLHVKSLANFKIDAKNNLKPFVEANKFKITTLEKEVYEKLVIKTITTKDLDTLINQITTELINR
jgi:hypothetical protein